MPLGSHFPARIYYLYAVSPVACGVVDDAECVDCIVRVRLSVRHEQTAGLQSVAERIHLGVDKQR